MQDKEATPIPIITVDGPGGAGKGTVSGLLAKQLGWNLLDSGALYRLVALAALARNLSVEQEAAMAELAQQLDVEFITGTDELVTVLLEGREVNQAVRTEAVGGLASQIAAIDAVRAALLERQRDFAQAPGLVGDGRDLGTVVFPAAQLKIYLTASAEERARRRLEQLRSKGLAARLCDLKKEIQERDERDMNRATAPLKPAADALIIDSTNLSVAQVVEQILAAAKNRGLVP